MNYFDWTKNVVWNFDLGIYLIWLIFYADQTVGETIKGVKIVAPVIADGWTVLITDIPWQAYIDLEGAYCGGTIITKSYILTAAHCTE